MPIRSFLTLAVAALLFTSGCELFGSEDRDDTIQPLAVGNTWTFVDSVYGAAPSVSELTIRVPGRTSIREDGRLREVFKWEVSAGGEVLRTNLVSVEDGDFWHHGIITGPDTLLLRTLWAPYPVSVGDTFEDERYTYDAQTGTYTLTGPWTWRCIDTDAPMRVGGETLEAVVFSTTPEEGTEHRIYYAVGVGYAGWTTLVDGSPVFSERLRTYTLR